MITREYTVVLTPEPEGGFTVTVPALPGCVGFSETEEEALELARDGIRFHIDSLVAEGQPVPEEVDHPRIVRLRLNIAARPANPCGHSGRDDPQSPTEKGVAPKESVVTRSRLTNDLCALGLRAGDLVMLHVSVKAIGWVVGGPDVVLQAILDVIAPDGTLMMYVGTEDSTYHFASWPEERRQAYLQECPPFDSRRTRAYRKWSVLTEYLRTWPGAHRSQHPDGSFAAVGRLAEWITKDHPLQYGYGPGSPLAKLCEADGRILLLGSPLSDVTLLHYSEHAAHVPGKRVHRYLAPVLELGRRAWVEIEEYDTSDPIPGYAGGDYFEVIVRDFLAADNGRTGTVGQAESYLLDASPLHIFAASWLERTLGGQHRRKRAVTPS